MKNVRNFKNTAEILEALHKGKKVAEYNWNGYEYIYLVNGQLRDENNNPANWNILFPIDDATGENMEVDLDYYEVE